MTIFCRCWLLLLCLSFFKVDAKNIAIVTVVAGESYYQNTMPGVLSKMAYCKKHGYDFICYRESLDPSRHPAWSKIKAVQQALEKYDWVFWSDADSIIMNSQISLENIIDENVSLLICYDNISHFINSGEFLIKKSPWSFDFLDRVYEKVEYITHPWWDNAAMIKVCEETAHADSHFKVLPQRIMNSFAPEVCGNNNEGCYQEGDFIVHFPSVRDQVLLKSLMWKYYNQRKTEINCTLDQYLNNHGYSLSPLDSRRNEGYMTELQKGQFREQLQLHPEIKTILEIGLNGGHSAENFFKCCSSLTQFVSFDIQFYPYVAVARDYFEKKYENRFVYIQGDSLKRVPEYAQQNPMKTFDLIYIDGSHAYQFCLNDIINCKALASSNTILWIDDFAYDVEKAVRMCESLNLIKIDAINTSDDPCGYRCWIQAHYLF